MQQYINYILYAIVLLCLSNCVTETKRVDNRSIIIDRDGPEGHIKSEIPYINDTIIDGTAKYYYYPTDIVKDEIEFNNGVKEGWHKHYKEDGTLESKVQFSNDVQDGETYWYYPDSKIKEHTHWVMGKQYGSAKYYYPNSKLKTYNAIDFYDNTLYVLRYDEQGNKVQDDGVVFSPEYGYVPHRDSMPINGETFIQIAVAEPPDTKTTIRMGELGKELKELEIKRYTATYQDTFTTVGKHTLVTVGKIYDLEGNLIKRDSVTTEITVIE